MSKLLSMWRPSNQTSARVCLIWQAKCHRLPRASDQLATAFWQSTLMRFRMISLQTLLSRSRVLWRYPKYRFQVCIEGEGHSCGLETKAELRSNSHAGPNDQSGPRAIHDEAGAIASHRTSGQPRDLSLARTRGGSIDRKSGYGSEVGRRFPTSASGKKADMPTRSSHLMSASLIGRLGSSTFR